MRSLWLQSKWVDSSSASMVGPFLTQSPRPFISVSGVKLPRLRGPRHPAQPPPRGFRQQPRDQTHLTSLHLVLAHTIPPAGGGLFSFHCSVCAPLTPEGGLLCLTVSSLLGSYTHPVTCTAHLGLSVWALLLPILSHVSLLSLTTLNAGSTACICSHRALHHR